MCSPFRAQPQTQTNAVLPKHCQKIILISKQKVFKHFNQLIAKNDYRKDIIVEVIKQMSYSLQSDPNCNYIETKSETTLYAETEESVHCRPLFQ